jgi:large repetitive protein
MVDSLRIISGAPLDLNTTFNGSSQTNLLATGSANNYLESLDSTVIQFKIKVRTSLFLYDFKNTIIGQAVTEQSVTMVDSSNTGLNPNPDGDKNPYNNNVPTVVSFIPNMLFGITKVGEIKVSDNNAVDVTYTISVHNLGNDTLRNVTVKDSLFNNTIKSPATYSIKFAPSAFGGGLVANSSYDGKSNINLLNSTQSKLYPNSVSSIYFTIRVIPGQITSISNSAYGTAEAIFIDTTVLSDSSNAGTNPDANGNNICNEASDNAPTVLLVPSTQTLFIPEGFSPDGDNINDYFVINGLSTDGNNPITIFNRWGNKVYQNGNYDNTWDGTPNVSGTLGKQKLPPGTYYYVLEMKGSGKKPITGFVVIQY